MHSLKCSLCIIHVPRRDGGSGPAKIASKPNNSELSGCECVMTHIVPTSYRWLVIIMVHTYHTKKSNNQLQTVALANDYLKTE